jgi:hypothetical protein
MLFEKVLVDQHVMAFLCIFHFFGLMQFNMLWIFVGLCGSNLSSGLELCPDQASGKGKSGGPKPSKPKDSAKVVELRSPILSGNLLILITLRYARTLAIPYISLYHMLIFLVL